MTAATAPPMATRVAADVSEVEPSSDAAPAAGVAASLVVGSSDGCDESTAAESWVESSAGVWLSAGSTAKVNVPSTGCPSAETIGKETVTSPAEASGGRDSNYLVTRLPSGASEPANR